VTTTTAHNIDANNGAVKRTVNATAHPCGLLTYRIPDSDEWEPDSIYRWRVGHHSGLVIAAGITETDVLAAVPVLAPLADWTASVSELRDALPFGPPSGVWQRLGEEHDVVHPRYR
jgi:hypothetical protein